MIDYNILSESVKYYNSKGFRRIESPWTVSEAASKITAPEGVIINKLQHNGKCLVASGEQSFLYLMIKGFLSPGRYQTITPCFRDDSFDTMHSKYFMKNELIITDNIDNSGEEIAHIALEFVKLYLPEAKIMTMLADGERGRTYDIVWYNHRGEGYEIGSYGYRSHNNLRWIYGTGIAEPRLSSVMSIRNGIPSSGNT
jgi:hypothetical protein